MLFLYAAFLKCTNYASNIIYINVLVHPSVTLLEKFKKQKKTKLGVHYCSCEQRNFTNMFKKEVIFRTKISGEEELNSNKVFTIQAKC